MASILVIGVGSTGLSVMEQAQQFYYEFTKTDSPGRDKSAFMFIETDANRHAQHTPNGTTDIVRCSIATNNVTATLTNWKKAPQRGWGWIPDDATVLDAGTGAGGQPIFGRVALWANATAVSNQIQALYQQIGGNVNTNIYLVGALTGGTGTGTFLDLAYMVRQITANNNIYGMFLLPDRTSVGQQTKDVLYENAYSSLRSLDKYSRTENGRNYECTLPGGTILNNLNAPFKNVQFLTQDFADASASMGNLSDLIQSAGFNLALRYLDLTHLAAPFQDLVNARLVDYTTNVPNGKFTTIGFNMFQYPESLLEEYFTTSLLESDLLKRWIDNDNYYDKNGTLLPISNLKSKLKIEVYQFVQEAIDAAVTQCQGNQMLGKSTFNAALQSEIDTIFSGKYEAPSRENYIFSLFDANSRTPKFHAAISGQNTMLRDALIQSIYTKINEESTKYQNLEIVRFIIGEIISDISKITDDWKKRFRIEGTPEQWNNCWTAQIKERIDNKALAFIYKATNCTREWLTEALGGVAKLCYFDVFMPELQKIADSMANKVGTVQLMTPTGLKLPTLQNADELIAKVNGLLDTHNPVSIVARSGSIAGQMSNNSNPQLNFLFSGNSYETDFQNAQSKYQMQPERLNYDNISHDDLWDYLYKQDIVGLKSDMISKGMTFVQSLNLFANTDVVNIMRNLQPAHHLYNKVNNLLNGMPNQIQKDTPAMCHLISTEQFTGHQCLKLICISPVDGNVQTGIVANMRNFKPSLNNSNLAVLPSMKNTVVIYQEYGYLGQVNGAHKTFNPVVHLSYQPQVLTSIKNKIRNGNYDEKLRLAYIDTKTLTDTDNLKIK